MKENSFSYFSNTSCPYYPCHSGADRESFNCLFCYCPLYALGDKCGGDFSYTEQGIKDCSGCLLPHGEDGFEHVMSGYDKIAELVRKKEPEDNEELK